MQFEQVPEGFWPAIRRGVLESQRVLEVGEEEYGKLWEKVCAQAWSRYHIDPQVVVFPSLRIAVDLIQKVYTQTVGWAALVQAINPATGSPVDVYVREWAAPYAVLGADVVWDGQGARKGYFPLSKGFEACSVAFRLPGADVVNFPWE